MELGAGALRKIDKNIQQQIGCKEYFGNFANYEASFVQGLGAILAKLLPLSGPCESVPNKICYYIGQNFLWLRYLVARSNGDSKYQENLMVQIHVWYKVTHRNTLVL